MNASPPTPPSDIRFETDEEQEAEDMELFRWKPTPRAKSAKGKQHAKVSAPVPPPQKAVRKVQRPPQYVTISFYLVSHRRENSATLTD
jgi:hypothetical protein